MKFATLQITAMVLVSSLLGCAHKPARVAPKPAAATRPAASRPAASAPTAKPGAEGDLGQRLAKDPIAVFQEGLDRYSRTVKSYACVLYKQERLNPRGPMGPVQKMESKFMQMPFSVFTDSVENPIGAKKVLFVEGKWENRMLAQPTGPAGLLGFVLVDPHSPEVRANTLQSVDQFGFKRNAETIVRDLKTARREGVLSVKVVGEDTIEGRSAIVCDAKVTHFRPGQFQYPHIKIWVDREWLLPIAIDTWDEQGIERGHYRYGDINLTANLTANDFTPEANGMRLPLGVK